MADASRIRRPRAVTRFETGMLAMMPRLRRYARSLSRNAADADDLLQQCLENAIARQRTWRGDNLAAWLMTIMTNLSRNAHRQRQRASHIVAIDAGPEPAYQPDETVPLEARRLHAAIDGLDPDRRAVLMLVAVEGYSYAEVAAMLGIPPGTVMSRLSRARRDVAERMRGAKIVDLRRP